MLRIFTYAGNYSMKGNLRPLSSISPKWNVVISALLENLMLMELNMIAGPLASLLEALLSELGLTGERQPVEQRESQRQEQHDEGRKPRSEMLPPDVGPAPHEVLPSSSSGCAAGSAGAVSLASSSSPPVSSVSPPV